MKYLIHGKNKKMMIKMDENFEWLQEQDLTEYVGEWVKKLPE